MKYFLFMLVFISHSSAALCPPERPEPVRVTLTQQQTLTESWLMFGETADHFSQLQLWEGYPGRLHAQLDLKHADLSSTFQAQPLIEDANLDGIADHFWIMGVDGQLWRLGWQEGQFMPPQLMADLRDSGLRFLASAGLLRTRLPSTLAPLAWRQADQQLALFIARDKVTGHDSLVMLRFAVNHTTDNITQFSQLQDRTLFTASEQTNPLAADDWRALLANRGWYVQFPGKVSATPNVIAGVIYAPVANTVDPDACVTEQTEQTLYALHLHTATPIYAKRNQSIPYVPNANLTLATDLNNQLVLVLSVDDATIPVLDNLLKISKACHDCTEPLKLDKYPLWRRLATYRSELGAY